MPSMIPRRRIEAHTMSVLIAKIDEMKAALQETAEPDGKADDERIAATEERIKALEAKPDAPAGEVDLGPIIDAVATIGKHVKEARDRRRSFHFEAVRTAGKITGFTAHEIEVPEGETRLEDVVDELDDLERMMRQSPARYRASAKAQKRHKELRRIQERQISG